MTVPAESLTNFSEAARKAWHSQPRRQVGRRKGTRLCDRVSVTLRIDCEVWERFRSVEAEDGRELLWNPRPAEGSANPHVLVLERVASGRRIRFAVFSPS